MDPNANLDAMLERARAIIAMVKPPCVSCWTHETGKPPVRKSDIADELAELVVALDEWLSTGGFLPNEWSKVAWQNGVTLAQANVLGSKVKMQDTMHVTMGGDGLGSDRLYVSYTNDPFVLGIDREGRASS